VNTGNDIMLLDVKKMDLYLETERSNYTDAFFSKKKQQKKAPEGALFGLRKSQTSG
jgi:hypothetical protein